MTIAAKFSCIQFHVLPCKQTQAWSHGTNHGDYYAEPTLHYPAEGTFILPLIEYPVAGRVSPRIGGGPRWPSHVHCRIELRGWVWTPGGGGGAESYAANYSTALREEEGGSGGAEFWALLPALNDGAYVHSVQVLVCVRKR